MDFYFPVRKARREIIQPQLMAMIAIFSLITLFLVAGTVFGTSSVFMPENLKLPKSFSRDDIVSAPQVTLTQDGVRASFVKNKVYPYEIFFAPGRRSADLDDLRRRTTAFVKKMSHEAKESGILLNVVADSKTSYRVLYDVVAVFRKSGFESVLFVSESEAQGGASE